MSRDFPVPAMGGLSPFLHMLLHPSHHILQKLILIGFMMQLMPRPRIKLQGHVSDAGILHQRIHLPHPLAELAHRIHIPRKEENGQISGDFFAPLPARHAVQKLKQVSEARVGKHKAGGRIVVHPRRKRRPGKATRDPSSPPRNGCYIP